MTYPVPSNEAERLGVLSKLDLLDTPREQAFDDLCREAAQTFGAPTALITLLDAKRQWFKARVGFEACETTRGVSFCNYVIAEDAVLVVPDTWVDPRFAANPLVVGPPHIRFYAGAPLYYGQDIRLGALCIIDQKPRTASEIDISTLKMLADRVAGEIWVRQALHAPDDRSA